MTISPISSAAELFPRFPNRTAPAGLQILSAPKRVLPPISSDGNGLPPDKIIPYSGIYDEKGHLPSPPSGLTFIAKV